MSNARKRSNSKGKEKLFLDWSIYTLLVDDLALKIRASGIKFDYIYGIPRGGLIPATILSHALGIKLKTICPYAVGNCDYKDVLIVDDIVDTARTMKLVAGKWPGAMIYTASLFKHKKCKWKPDFFVSENDKWIVFPYEKENE